MALWFQLTIAYAVELPEGDFDHLEADGLSILTEGEEGNRQFLGFSLIGWSAEDAYSEPFELPEINPHLKEKLNAIAVANDFGTPELWSIGSAS